MEAKSRLVTRWPQTCSAWKKKKICINQKKAILLSLANVANRFTTFKNKRTDILCHSEYVATANVLLTTLAFLFLFCNSEIVIKTDKHISSTQPKHVSKYGKTRKHTLTHTQSVVHTYIHPWNESYVCSCHDPSYSLLLRVLPDN
jgi:hypothetical protein